MALDASIALAWTFTDERTDAVADVFWRVVNEGACVPCHWHLEIANVMRTAMRKGRASPAERDGYLLDLSKLRVEVDTETIERAWTSTVELSDRYALTVYDAAYLELAMRRALPLATLDKELIAAARAEGVPVLP